MRNILVSWFLPILSFTVVVTVSIALIFPWVKDIFSKRDEIVKEENQLNEVLTPKLQILQTLNKEGLRTQLTQIELILPSNINAPFVFANIENLANQNEVGIEGLSYASSKKEEVLELGFIANGEPDSLANFVNSLEQATPLAVVNFYSQSKNENEPDTVSLKITSFYKTLPEKVGGVKESLKEWDKIEQETLSKIGDFQVYLPIGETTSQPVPVGKQNPF